MFDPIAAPSSSPQVTLAEFQTMISLLKVVVGTMVAGIMMIVGFTWKTARSRQLEELKLDHGEKAYREVFGVPEEKKIGLIQRTETVENVVESVAGRHKLMTEVTHVHTSDPAIAAQSFEARIKHIAKEGAEEAARARRALIEDQERRFGERFPTGSHRAITPPPVHDPLHEDDRFDSISPPPGPRRR